MTGKTASASRPGRPSAPQGRAEPCGSACQDPGQPPAQLPHPCRLVVPGLADRSHDARVPVEVGEPAERRQLGLHRIGKGECASIAIEERRATPGKVIGAGAIRQAVERPLDICGVPVVHRVVEVDRAPRPVAVRGTRCPTRSRSGSARTSWVASAVRRGGAAGGPPRGAPHRGRPVPRACGGPIPAPRGTTAPGPARIVARGECVQPPEVLSPAAEQRSSRGRPPSCRPARPRRRSRSTRPTASRCTPPRGRPWRRWGAARGSRCRSGSG